MIDAIELRIGNLVASKEDGAGYVTSINRKGEIRCIKVNSESFAKKFIPPFAELHPIPLTPELLEKCGAKLIRSSKFYNVYGLPNGFVINYCKTDQYKDVAYGHSKGNWYHEHIHTPLNSLHMLQNAYYAVLGKELEIQPL